MTHTKEQLLVAKEILLNLISECREINDIYYGICWNADKHTRNDYDESIGEGLVYMYSIVDQLSWGWQHHSGITSYPVPFIKGNKWEGENLELRIDLMKYIVSKIDDLLQGD